MKAFLALLTILPVSVPGASAGTPTCPFREPGYYPWSTDIPDVVDGDMWAWVYLDLDKTGDPLRCYIGESNMSSPETRSKVCRSFVNNWRAAPLRKDGKAVAGTTRRFFTVMGDRHEKLFNEARKGWFAEHPQDSPACYEDD